MDLFKGRSGLIELRKMRKVENFGGSNKIVARRRAAETMRVSSLMRFSRLVLFGQMFISFIDTAIVPK